MSGLNNLQRIAIGVAVFADAAVAGEVVVLSQQFARSRAPEQRRSGRQQGRAEEIPPRDSLIHPKSMITGMNFRSKVRFVFPGNVRRTPTFAPSVHAMARYQLDAGSWPIMHGSLHDRRSEFLGIGGGGWTRTNDL